MINLPRPERGVLCISIVDIISKSALVLFSLLCASNYHYNKGPVIVDNITNPHNKWRILLYYLSTVNIAAVSDQYWFYLYLRDCSENRQNVPLYIELQ